MKIFGIGLNRTGTKSLNRALRQLGYNCVHYPLDSVTAGEVIAGRPYSLLRHYDGITDLHATVRFRELDSEYPGSKFILTYRDKPGWLESCRRHFDQYKKNPDPQPIRTMSRVLHTRVYGLDEFDEATFRDSWDAHVAAIADHFHVQVGRLLAINIVAGDGWEKLCPFLDQPIPDRPFPRTR